MVAGRAHGAKGVLQLAGHHRIGGRQRGTGRMQRGREGVAVDGGVGVDLGVLGAAGLLLLDEALGQALQRGHMHAVMGQFDVGQRGLGGLVPLQRIGHAGHQQPVLDGVQPGRALWVPRPHLMPPALPMGEITRLAHSDVSAMFFLG